MVVAAVGFHKCGKTPCGRLNSCIQRRGSFVALFARLEVHLHFALLLLVSQGYKVDLEEKGPKFPAEVGILRLTTDHSSWLAANPGRGNILKVFDTIVVGCCCTDL